MRFTFVVQVHPDGIKTLENLGTRERLALDDLAEVGPQIERWLQAPARSANSSASAAGSPSSPPNPSG